MAYEKKSKMGLPLKLYFVRILFVEKKAKGITLVIATFQTKSQTCTNEEVSPKQKSADGYHKQKRWKYCPGDICLSKSSLLCIQASFGNGGSKTDLMTDRSADANIRFSRQF